MSEVWIEVQAKESEHPRSAASTDTQEVRVWVDAEVERMNAYLRRELKMQPMLRMEASILREYLHAKLRQLF